ncbi:GNAT family N-acetyltransferase [Nocardia terpenica]|uniref:GNAT family N-acetyltransferase n=1 Tax=Nocardia terpenica TaxID=455432 RepID=UPI001893C76E|nr:GNAT family N-acetyltransferase [Nocardia terpenica]MBF6061238.1 GNAT family N-acetyltransferase [Nocardia terpenica]MBF6105533.1 GNAT family N-acetyltransferase [Nocardia terpenica]MBF6112997.1 GNAT family N-acetyltransferase [Nocardia terpenica]MBF6119127.1 GNAT family N-acetyltransferase [Nocardia terpenica]MBF6152775.1 GNAT family N-acetyltransferase [Nocardia terpenica]
MATIRSARSTDSEALSELARTAYAHYVDRIGREPAPMMEDYGYLISLGNVWVAEQCGSIVGLLVLEVEPDHLLLNNVAVSPEVQGTGIGAQLLAFAEMRAREHDLSEIRLYTNEAMTENIDYYPRHGYVETHRATEEGYSRVFFAKQL